MCWVVLVVLVVLVIFRARLFVAMPRRIYVADTERNQLSKNGPCTVEISESRDSFGHRYEVRMWLADILDVVLLGMGVG
jgi:hypothetical protein